MTGPLEFLVESLPLLPAGAVSGDFHVHGAASFDSSIPDQDRVVSFLATGLDVVVATDHDVVTTYEETLNDAERDRKDRGDPRRRTDAEHLVVLGAGRGLPEDARALQFLAAGIGPDEAPQRRALG